jgi:hypothetical protein
MEVDDFYLEMKWEFESSLIPFFSKLAPSDIFKMTKRGYITIVIGRDVHPLGFNFRGPQEL